MTNSGSPRGRAATAVALTAVLALTATACGDDGSGAAGAEGSGKGTITFWDNNGGVRTAVWQEIIKDFEAANPGIEVRYVPIPSEDVQSKYDTAIAGGGLPDVGGVGAAYLANMVAQNALDPVGKRIEESSLKGKLVPGMVESVKSAGGRGDEMYSVPTSASNGVLYYRTDLFKAAGLPAPTTWDAFYTAAEKLTDARKNRFGYTIRGGAGSIAQALDAMYGQSGITEFWKDGKTTVNDPKNVAALEKYVGLYRKATPEADVNNDFKKMNAQFDAGSIAMMNHNLGSYTDHVNALGTDRFAGIPNPTGPGGVRVQVSNPVDGLSLFRTGKNKAAAWKFIEFAASHQANSRWNESAGAIPANTDAARDPWLEKAQATKLGAQALTDGSTRIVQLPYYLPDWNKISKSENEPNFQKLLLGATTAQKFLDTLAQQLDEAQAEWNEQFGKD
ncbi:MULTISPECIES: ABC transporter substrate-binding protein [Streptomyces]|uniref:Multiple sugar-binding protein n=2 Tax=Streptomyces fradiae TaxID=1906 RepID=A0A1Y2NTA4_STRFR|nr:MULTISPECIES: sugar ABC transporter substrate-binding protein [Streptomyces]OSY50734.1 Multiple sugar-binding protein precursor [Streptomyces fradiae ATCC 10745 = DSM 40063]QEV11593.1 sugar ABC transporter substrate-binding protein [Streptomyces fradiae ATCC 10745 = DSM 40063]